MLSLKVRPSPDPFRRNHLLRKASWQAVYDAMGRDDSVHVFGEGAQVKAHYDAPAIDRDYGYRVHTLPICEDGSTNFAVGASLVGVKPVVDVIVADFLYRTLDSICNTAAKLDFVTGQGHTIVVRSEFFTGGPTTGQRPEALFAHIPGLRVVVPSTPHDAYGLMMTALLTPGVTLFFEDRMIEDIEFGWPSDTQCGDIVPLGIASCRTKADAGGVTVVTYGLMRQVAEHVLGRWCATTHSVPKRPYDLVDLRTIYPLDWPLLKTLVAESGKLLILEPDVQYGGIGAEIAARIAEEMPGVRVKRLGAPRTTIPASTSLHAQMLPGNEEIIRGVTDW